VDVKNATWTNSIGAAELIGVWQDPNFDPSLQAFYYARVIEIPTPRWTAYEAKRFKIEMPDEVPMITTERAYTSPIWYTPKC
jgi:antitoxin component HigA of HigAB toxin-antitoxin module